MRRNSKNTISDFWRYVDVRSDDECWEWTRCKNKQGYGQFRFMGKMRFSHRIALSTVENVPDNMHVLHLCDNPACCNPAHLRVGTHTDNMRDKISKGRANTPCGEDHCQAKITEPEAFFIRYSDMSLYRLGKIFGISPATVSNIKEGKTWKHLP